MENKKLLELIAKEEAFLDTIDIVPYLVRDMDLVDVMDVIEDRHNDEYTEEEYIFSTMNLNEFINYLERRYPKFNYYEDTQYRVGYMK